MIIYVLSSDGFEGVGSRSAPRAHTSGEPYDAQTIIVEPSYTMLWLADDIKHRVDRFRRETGRADEKIRMLRMDSHGNAGEMTIGEGLNVHTADAFGVLRNGYFEPESGGIELWGCGVASAARIDDFYTFDVDSNGDGIMDIRSRERQIMYENFEEAINWVYTHPSSRRGMWFRPILRGSDPASGNVEDGLGYRMMHTLAAAAQTSVTAGYDMQIPDLDGADWEWDGARLLRVHPNGDSEIISLVNFPR